jgi:hypothetical protein
MLQHGAGIIKLDRAAVLLYYLSMSTLNSTNSAVTSSQVPGDQFSLLKAEEEARLAALRRYQILDTPAEADFDNCTAMAADICEAPVAIISLVDRDRQWFKSEIGLGVQETPLGSSICRHAILQHDIFIVPDTTRDERFRENPLVTADPHLRFYAGALLKSSDGQPIGTLCVLDRKPRTLTESQTRALQILSRQVMTLFELRLAISQLGKRNAELESARREIRKLEELLPICSQCKKIHDKDDWVPVEEYMHRHDEVNFTHGLCPTCSQKYHDDLELLKLRNHA